MGPAFIVSGVCLGRLHLGHKISSGTEARGFPGGNFGILWSSDIC